MMSKVEERRLHSETWTEEEQLKQYCRDIGFPKTDTSNASKLPKVESPPMVNAQRPQRQDDSGRS